MKTLTLIFASLFLRTACSFAQADTIIMSSTGDTTTCNAVFFDSGVQVEIILKIRTTMSHFILQLRAKWSASLLQTFSSLFQW